MNWFGSRYKDEALALQAEQAIAEDVILNDISSLSVNSKNGVVSLAGKVNSERERAHAEDAVRSALERASLKHKQLVNALEVK